MKLRNHIFLAIIIAYHLRPILVEAQHSEPLISFPCEKQDILNTLNQLEKKYDLTFYVDHPEKLANKFSGKPCQDAPLHQYLQTLLGETAFDFIIYDSRLVFLGDSSRLNHEKFDRYFKQKNILDEDDIEKVNWVGNPDSINRSGLALIHGLVIDGKTDSVVVGAMVSLGTINKSAATEIDGSFRIELQIGTYNLNVDAPMYHSFQKKIKVYGDGSLIIKLFTSSIDLPELVIGGSARNHLESAQAGIAVLQLKEIKRLPSFMGEADVLKALLTLPGVSNTGEAGTGINVRGGNIDQNLIQQEGVFYLNPSHVLGLFSSFNPDAIKQVTLYKGHVPAQFGGRTSSVLDIKLKDPDYKLWSVFGGIGPISSKLFVEGPIIKNKTSFFIGSRFTYSDWVLDMVQDPNLKNSQANFHDINLKISQRLGLYSSIQFSAYQSRDRFRYSDQFGYGWQSRSGSLNYHQAIRKKWILNAAAIYSDNINDFEDGTSPVPNKLENGLNYFKGRINLAWQASEKHDLVLGTERIMYNSRPEKFTAGIVPDILIEELKQSKGQETSLFINDEFKLDHRISFSVGIRQTWYVNKGHEIVNLYEADKQRVLENQIGSKEYATGKSIISYSAPEPRISVAFKLNEHGSVKAAYNRLNQYIHLVSNTAAATPVDIWQMSNSYFKPQTANNFSLGYYKNSKGQEWESSLEIYYRKSKDLIEYKDFAQLLRNDHKETDLFSVNGRSYGAEIYIKRLRNNPSGYLSYTWSRSLRKTQSKYSDEIINKGKWYASNFDKPHNLNVVFNWQIKKTMALSANFVYTSGRPLSAPVSDFYLGDGGLYLDYSQRNELRIPNYHRMDVSYTVTRGAIRTRKRKGSLTFAVYNIYGRKNAFSVFFRRNVNEPPVAYKLAVLGSALPSVTYNFQF